MTHAVILAGGRGERLWPMSTRERPKQLLTLSGDATLVRSTLERIAPLVSPETALVLTNAGLREGLIEELAPIPPRRIIGEPVGRNTAPAIALAAAILSAEDPDAVMVVLPADHIVGRADRFLDAIALAAEAAESERALVTLGIVPTRPETEYGYMKSGGPAATTGVLTVESFEEKPDLTDAESFIADGGYYWNSGMFIWRADVFLREVQRHLPALAGALRAIRSAPGEAGFDAQLSEFYGSVEGISVDYGVMERADRVLVVPADIGWDDVGAWPAVARIWPADREGNTARGDVVIIDSTDSIAFAEDGLVAVLGMDGVVVVRTSDATLVCPKTRARDVRRIVEELRARGQG